MFYFSFLHFPLSGPVLTNISLPIIPCMIVYVTNNKEPWTLNLFGQWFFFPSTAAPLLGLSSDKQRRHVSPVSGESRHILSEDTI